MRSLLMLLGLFLAQPAVARSLRLEKVVLLYRHGVRAPLDTETALDGIAHPPLPPWPVAPSLLTPHGAAALAEVGRWRRAQLVRAGLWRAADCPGPGDLVIWTNTADRTIASGAALARGLAPGCPIQIGHLAPGQTDPLFEPLPLGLVPFNAAAAIASINRYTGGLPALTSRYVGELWLLSQVIGCAEVKPPCRLAEQPGTLAVSEDGRDLAVTGAIRRFSGTAQVLLLEYLEGLPRSQVGWGRASPAVLRRLGKLHAALFDIYTRPPYLAARAAGPLARRIGAILNDAQATHVTAFVGHDSNVSALAALLGTTISASGYAPGDPPPGGALMFELWRDRAGARWVRLRFEAATPDQIRRLDQLGPAHRPGQQALALPTCRGAVEHQTLCPLPKLLMLLEGQ